MSTLMSKDPDNVDARANIVALYTDCHCIVQSVQYQLRFLDK